jgi:hypothetical protein
MDGQVRLGESVGFKQILNGVRGIRSSSSRKRQSSKVAENLKNNEAAKDGASDRSICRMFWTWKTRKVRFI